jgi:acid stress-induced BolA-like protein IbaG/YrbA
MNLDQTATEGLIFRNALHTLKIMTFPEEEWGENTGVDT